MNLPEICTLSYKIPDPEGAQAETLGDNTDLKYTVDVSFAMKEYQGNAQRMKTLLQRWVTSLDYNKLSYFCRLNLNMHAAFAHLNRVKDKLSALPRNTGRLTEAKRGKDVVRFC